VFLIILPLITAAVSELMTISAHPRRKAHVYQVMLARDGEDKPPLPAHSLNWYQDGLSSKLLEMDAISTASPDHQFKGKTGKLLDWQLFPFPLQNSSTRSPAWHTVTGLHPVLTYVSIQHCQGRALTPHCSLRIHGLEECRSLTFLIS